jgi:DNA-3-methyladenine glycosylase
LVKKSVYPVLGNDFYRRSDVIQLGRELLGKVIVTRLNGHLTSGIITETEAYAGVTDRASHAWGGRLTERTKIMYEPGGVSYVYLCYGIHHLFNIITGPRGVPHAVLLRAVEPLDGLPAMLARRGMSQAKRNLTAGPGLLTRALGITVEHNGTDLTGDAIWLEDRGINVGGRQIMESARVGVHYAGEDAGNPWRFRIKNNPFTSPAR